MQFSRHAVLNDVHLFNPNLINEFRFGYTRSNGSNIGRGQESAPFAQQAGLAMFPFPVLGFPSMVFSPTGQISGTTSYSGFGGGGSNLNFESLFQWIDNVTLIRGNHALKFGTDVRGTASISSPAGLARTTSVLSSAPVPTIPAQATLGPTS